MENITGINETNLNKLALDILDIEDNINKILNSIDDNMEKVSKNYDSNESNELLNKYHEFACNNEILKKNIHSYYEDFINLKTRTHNFDKNITLKPLVIDEKIHVKGVN